MNKKLKYSVSIVNNKVRVIDNYGCSQFPIQYDTGIIAYDNPYVITQKQKMEVYKAFGLLKDI